MPADQRQILVTSALPYANGPIHLGHMVEYIQTDIWVRFQKMRGHECHYVCADDAHGTPIMLRADKEGITPEQLIERISQEHQADFRDFLVDFDHYHSTHSKENEVLAAGIYEQLKAKGHIARKTIKQAYDPEKGMFLPDRFIRGTCPKCKAEDQYGDSCEKCGATYQPTELINPVSAISGATPVEKDTEHFFVKLGDFEDFLAGWTHDEGRLQAPVSKKLGEWFEAGLQDWDISRDAPYHGFEIPGEPGKYFYVWLDAPVGYMASFKALCDKQGLNFDDYWAADSKAELYHFIGKDIIYFHALFWPAMLSAADYRTPTGIFAHGFLTVDGEKMSKTRGTFVMARTYLEHFRPEYLRYYFAAKLSNGVDDLDLNLDDFTSRVNSDLVGKLVNIASRCAKFINGKFDNQLAAELPDPALQGQLAAGAFSIAECYEKRDYARAVREIMALADLVNQYIDEHKPWVLAKNEDTLADVQGVCTQGLNGFRVLMAYLKPVLPTLAAEVEAFLNVPPLSWEDTQTPLLGQSINAFKPLMTRVDPKQVAAMVEASKEDLKPAAATTAAKVELADPIAEEIEFDAFAKVDLRIATIIGAEHVDGAAKLLKLQLDIGDGQPRQVFAGIKSAYTPEQLQGRLTVMVANLKPRKMRFGLSEGMVLAAGPGGDELWILSPDDGAQPGMKVK